MRENVEQMPPDCTVEVAMTVLGGKWKLAILSCLFAGTRRFGELRRKLPGITRGCSPGSCASSRATASSGAPSHAEVPPRVQYALTDAGRSLEEIARQLEAWGEWYRAHRSASRREGLPQADRAQDPENEGIRRLAQNVPDPGDPCTV